MSDQPKVSEILARTSSMETVQSILDPGVSSLQMIGRSADAIVQLRAELRAGYRRYGAQPPLDDGIEARALRIRERVMLARDAIRRKDAAHAVEHAVIAATWLADLHWFDAPPDFHKMVREQIRAEAQADDDPEAA